MGLSVLRIYGAAGAGLTYGQGSVATGTYFSLRGGGAGFRGLLLQRSVSVPAADGAPGKRWRRPGSAGRLTGLRVQRARGS